MHHELRRTGEMSKTAQKPIPQPAASAPTATVGAPLVGAQRADAARRRGTPRGYPDGSAKTERAGTRPAPTDTDLPEGWGHTTLIDLAEHIQYGYTASAVESQKGPRFLRITDIQDGSVNWDSVPTCQIDATKFQKYRLQSGDILFARTGATTGKSYLIGSFPKEAVFASYLIRVRPLSLVNPAFLSFCFQTPEYWQFISENIAGNAQPNCNATKLASLTLPVPPLEEQKRIVAKTEELLTQVNAARDRLAKVPKILKRFRQSVLAAACSGRLTEDWREQQTEFTEAKELYDRIQKLRSERYERDSTLAAHQGRRKPADPRNAARSNKPVIELPDLPQEWGLFPLQDLSYLITDGTHRTPEYLEDGVVFLSVKNIRPFRILDAEIKRISLQEHKEINARCNPEPGDILYTKIGSYGYAAANEISYPFSLFVSVALIKPVRECLLTEYAEIVMNSEIVFAQARDRVSGSGTPDLHLIEIRDFRIPLPPPEEQHEIVRRIEALFKLAEAIEKRVEAATKRADKLTQAILGKAFRGELVPTEAELARREGRTYEPAAILLERIRTEHAGVQERPRARRHTKK